MKILGIITILFLTSSTSFAAEPSARNSFEQINNCTRREDAQSCRDLFTASSISLYDRFMSYGLVNCLPKDAQYDSQQNLGKTVLIRASVTDLGKKRYMRMFFVEEEGQWKLDVPESLHTAMGKDWKKQIEITENIYLLMRKQFGEKLDCNTIRSLVNVKNG